MASNRDAVRAALNERKRGKNGQFAREEEEDTSYLPDATDPEEDRLARLMQRTAAEEAGGEEDDEELDDLDTFEDEDEIDEEWDGSTPPKSQKQKPDTRDREAREAEESEIDQLRREAAQSRTLNQLYQRDPARLAELLLQRLDPASAQKVMQGLGGGQQRVAMPPPLQIGEYNITQEDWETMTTPERVAWVDAQTLRNEIPQQFSAIEQAVQQSNLYRDYHVERLETMVGVLAEALGIEMEPADTEAIDRLLFEGYDIKTAVAEAYGKRLRAKVKAKTKGRPRTPQSRPGGAPRLPKDATLNQIIAYQEKYGHLPED